MDWPGAISPAQARRVNRAAILEHLILSGPTSRAALARELGLSRATVRRLVAELKVARLVSDSAGLIEINGAGNLGVCLDLGATKLYGAVADPTGTIQFECTVDHHGSKGEAGYELVVGVLTKLLAEAQATGQSIMGIGAGVPGVTRHQEGVVTATAGLGWDDFPLGQRLRDRFGLPVIVDNDVNLAALGEAWFGVGKGCRSLVWINVGTGIGGGLIIDGRLYRGAHEMAGEIGYLLPGREFLHADYPGFGALELQAAGVGLARRASEGLAQAQISPRGEVTARTLVEAYRQGEEWAIPIVNETIDYLAIAIGAVCSVLDPEMVVLGGGVMQSLGFLVEPLAQRLEGKIPRVPPILISTLGPRAAVLGAMISLLTGADIGDDRKQP